jgi:hypothetical protein
MNPEQAGADALELNMYEVVTDLSVPSTHIESQLVGVVEELKRLVMIPVAREAVPFFTAFGNIARQLDEAGANGLVPRSVRACAIYPDAPQLDSVSDRAPLSSAAGCREIVQGVAMTLVI